MRVCNSLQSALLSQTASSSASEDQFSSRAPSTTFSPGHVPTGTGGPGVVVGPGSGHTAGAAHPRQQVRINQRQFAENEYVSDSAVVFGRGGLSLPSVPSHHHSPLQPPMPTSTSHAQPHPHLPQAPHPSQNHQTPIPQQQQSKQSSSSRWVNPLVRLHRRVSPLVPEEVPPPPPPLTPTGRYRPPPPDAWPADGREASATSPTPRRGSAGSGSKGCDARAVNGGRANKSLLDPPSPFGGAALELGTGPSMAAAEEDEEQTLRLYATPKTTRKCSSKK